MPETQISAHTLGFEWPNAWGASGKAYFWLSRDMVSADGVSYLGGTAGNLDQMLRSADITVEGGAATIDGVALPKTTDAQVGAGVRITGQIFDSRGVKRAEFFSGRINDELGDATNWPAVFVDNDCRRRPLGDTYPTTSRVIALIQNIAFALASLVEYGKVRLSRAPDDSADPVAVGKNDYASTTNAGVAFADTEPGEEEAPTFVGVNSPRLGTARGSVTLAGGEAVVAEDAVTADSLIFLSAQDDLTYGTLRVSAREAGVSFTITSSDGADRGVVAWEIYEP